METQTLSIRALASLPLKEISGLGQRRLSDDDVAQVLAVGDEEFTVLAGDVTEDPTDLSFDSYKLHDVMREGDPEAGSQWEAADGDQTGRVFVLQESPGKVFVIDRGFEKLLTTIDLSLDSDAGRGLEWTDEPNAQGEGLVLLSNGHILIAKEKDPPLLMEFGPSEADPSGSEPELVFLTDREFPLPDEGRIEYVLLKVWELDAEAGDAIGDISDVAVGPDRRLYLLSDESRCIARLEAVLTPGEHRLSAVKLWRLPEEVKQPEGLILLEDLSPVVAIDRSEKDDNLFVLDPLGS
jgi:uncharacterized protein YjiK